MTHPLLHPVILLDRPQLGDNIGMAARAMMNCGLNQLRLIAPRDGWPNQKAMDAAAGANAIIEQAVCYDSLVEATADLQIIFATTGRQRGLAISSLTPDEAMPQLYDYLYKEHKRVGILFGGERAGLGNEEISYANHILYFPLNPDFKSLNLSHAVLLVAWDWLKYQQSQGIETVADQWEAWQDANFVADLTNKAELDNLLNRLLDGMMQGGFFHNPELIPHVERNLRILLNKASLTDQELRTLHGIIRALRAAPALE